MTEYIDKVTGIIYGGGLIVAGGILVYLIIRRVKEKKNEDFEKRDN